MVGREGFDPSTIGLKVNCTNEEFQPLTPVMGNNLPGFFLYFSASLFYILPSSSTPFTTGCPFTRYSKKDAQILL
jgi:hypothetical protein